MSALVGVQSWLTTVTVQVVVLGIGVSMVQWVGRHRISSRWLYALWLLVFLRLVVPWMPQSPTSLYGVVVHAREALGVLRISVPAAVGASREAPGSEGWRAGVAALWLLGVVFLGARTAVREYRFRRVLGFARHLPPAAIGQGLRWVPVRETTGVDTPAVVGWLRPCLVVPPGLLDHLTSSQWQQVVWHEWSHIRRHDVAVRWAIEIVTVLYWWNPMVRLARRRVWAAQELVADADVLRTLPPDRRTDYGRTLLRVVQLRGRTRPTIVATTAGMARHGSLMERRIAMIRQPSQVVRRWSWVAALTGIALVLMAMTLPRMTTPSYFQENQMASSATVGPMPSASASYTTWERWAAQERHWYQSLNLPQLAAHLRLAESKEACPTILISIQIVSSRAGPYKIPTDGLQTLSHVSPACSGSVAVHTPSATRQV